jgi:hypothetical protein
MFNGVEYYERRGDKHKYTQPKLKVGDTIKLLYDDTEPRPKLPGEKRMKRGNYVVQQIRTGFSSKDSLVYVLVKNGAKYKFCMYTIPIDKAIEGGVIVVEEN